MYNGVEEIPIGIEGFRIGKEFFGIMKGIQRDRDSHSFFDVYPVVANILIAHAFQSVKSMFLFSGNV